MMIMNCSYNERPNYTKKRYYFLMSLLGLSSLYRNALNLSLIHI